MNRNYEKPEECPICYLKLGDINPQECGHYFHLSCLQQHFKPECPLCRHPLKIEVKGKLAGGCVQNNRNDNSPYDTDNDSDVADIEGGVDDMGYGYIMVENQKEYWRKNGYNYREEDPDYDSQNDEDIDYPETPESPHDPDTSNTPDDAILNENDSYLAEYPF
jgi:hypothetical protein